ncbi:hypothetical protein M408DRAFT_332992 [Serendipita vermifera MAFF 305830]|uniref:Uncharacterized protein n=1 Tax=Serendipita vermifera MAFF 305830 TaxID=933852 RepID=A0A0C3AL99_SERVB|nr:hypothetical protein M408DRAFT_334154 [Serendipita vermifera MAFF 305830]KIM22310.1 hypothetical protein M408DRAFT_332992 [Serendipita vermifera MAFF 305830]
MERVVHLLIKGEAKASPPSLALLRRGFESLLVGEHNNVATVPCISMPLQYRDGLRTHVALRPLHYSFTLLLARDLYTLSSTERIRRVKEIITMLWVTPVFHGLLDEEKVVRTYGVEGFFDANKEIMMTWIKNSATIPYIREILYHLATVQAEVPTIGSLWRVPTPHGNNNPRLFEVFKEFQDLINGGVTAVQHLTLIHLICHDLELGPPEIFESGFTREHYHELDGYLRDPCLRVIAQTITGSDIEPLPTSFIGPDSTKDSWARIATHLMAYYEGTNSPSILRTQASMWSLISDQTAICERALKEPALLAHLRRTFTYPISCSQHLDYEGHLLLHVLSLPPSELAIDLQRLTSVPMKGCQMEPLFIILLYICAGYDELPMEQPLGNIDRECLEQIWDLSKATMSSQLSVLSVLSDISTTRWVYPEHVAALSICVTKALELSYDPRIETIVQPLASRIERIKDQMLSGRRRSEAERDAAETEANKAIEKLTTYMAVNGD